MKRRELELQADRIETVLRDHKAPARVTGGTVTPRWVQYLLQTSPGIKVNKIESLSREIALALGAHDARISTTGGAVRIDVPRDDPQPVKFKPLYARLPPQIPFGAALLGLADDGAPLLMRLPSPDVSHVLIAGTTGSGKTALLRSIVLSLILRHRRSEIQLVLIDPKGGSFLELATAPHLLQPIVTQPDQASAALTDLVRIMDTRSQLQTQARSNQLADRATPISSRAETMLPQIVIVIDELADLIQTGGSIVNEALTRLVQRGREAGLHVIAATQQPSSSVLGSLMKANFPLRLVGRVVSADDARVATGVGGTHAEKLNGHGDFVAVTASGLVRFQAAYISGEDVGRMLQQNLLASDSLSIA